MDQERARVQADLRGLVDCEVHCSESYLHIYASDASIYQILPLGIVRPRNTADVVACVQYAAEHQIPIHARGAGSSLAGESLGPGLVFDFSHSMRRVLEVGEDFVRLQPGVVLAQLNRDLESGNLFFGPDPSTRSVTTMGSVIAIDASGSHWPQYGSARQHVLQLEVVTADTACLSMSWRRLVVPPPPPLISWSTESAGWWSAIKTRFKAFDVVRLLTVVVISCTMSWPTTH